MTIEMKATEVVTAPVRVSFPALFEPKPVSKDKPNELKYMATLLLPPETDKSPFFEAIKAAMVDKFGKAIKLPARNNPIKDCGEKELDGYEDGWSYINAKSGYQPSVVDQKAQPVMDKDAVYAGCWCRFHLQAFAWDHPQGGKGVSFSLSAVQLVKDDDRLDGRKSGADVFEPLAGFDASDNDAGTDAEELFG